MARMLASPDDASEPQPGRTLSSSELRLGRRELGLTQAQLAERLGVRANTVARWERGELHPVHPEQVARQLGRLLRAHDRQSFAYGKAGHRRRPRPGWRRTNLPAQLSTFVGREHALAEVRRLLRTTRLLSLVGAGGIGKTRLA